MNTITVFIGTAEALLDGRIQDNLQVVEFQGENLAEHTSFDRGRDGKLTHTRGTTETLYRSDDGRLVVHVCQWSYWRGETTISRIEAVGEADLGPNGCYTALGAAAGFGRALTLDEAVGS